MLELQAKIENITTELQGKLNIWHLLVLQVLCGSLILTIIYWVAVASTVSKTHQLRSSVNQRITQVSQLNQRVAKIGSLESQLQTLQARENTSIQEEPPIPRLLNHLGIESQTYNMAVKDVDIGIPKFVDHEFHVQEVPVSFVLAADYGSLQQYIHSLYKEIPFLRIDEVKIEQVKDQNMHSLQAHFKLSLFYTSELARVASSTLKKRAEEEAKMKEKKDPNASK